MKKKSHPVRGAWIEMRNIYSTPVPKKSHPVRGAWIEISLLLVNFTIE